MNNKALIGVLFLAIVLGGAGGCSKSKITRENYEKIARGMDLKEVRELLGGEGIRIEGVEFYGVRLYGGTYQWRDGKRVITVEVCSAWKVTEKSQEGL